MTPMNGLGISTSKFTFLKPITNNYSIDLDGTDDFVNLGNSSEIKLTETNTDTELGITIACWCKADDWNVTTIGPLISCTQSGGWKLDWSNRVIATFKNTTGATSVQSGFKPFESESDAHYRASGWHYIAGTYDGRYVKLYIDGTLEATADVGSTNNDVVYGTGNNNVDVCIGADPGPLTGGESGTSTGAAFFPGLIDEAAIWDKALDLDAIKEIFNAVDVNADTLDLTEDSGDYDYSDALAGYWKFENGAGITVSDLSNNSNHGVLKNGATWSTTIPT